MKLNTFWKWVIKVIIYAASAALGTSVASCTFVNANIQATADANLTDTTITNVTPIFE